MRQGLTLPIFPCSEICTCTVHGTMVLGAVEYIASGTGSVFKFIQPLTNCSALTITSQTCFCVICFMFCELWLFMQYVLHMAQQTTATTTVEPVSQSTIKMCMFSVLFGFYLNSFQLVPKKSWCEWIRFWCMWLLFLSYLDLLRSHKWIKIVTVTLSQNILRKK